MKAIMNKNVNYSGVRYEKGQAISEKDAGFDELVKAGHAVAGDSKSEEAVEESEGESEAKPKGKRR